ncbi:hypothetical protein SLEP1_g59478, partial [Rubroshorea leprosula]
LLQCWVHVSIYGSLGILQEGSGFAPSGIRHWGSEADLCSKQKGLKGAEYPAGEMKRKAIDMRARGGMKYEII